MYQCRTDGTEINLAQNQITLRYAFTTSLLNCKTKSKLLHIEPIFTNEPISDVGKIRRSLSLGPISYSIVDSLRKLPKNSL